MFSLHGTKRVLFRTGSVCALTAFAGAAAVSSAVAAAPSGSVHALPGARVAGVTQLCGPRADYGCTGAGYAGQSTGWPGRKYGTGWASRNAYGLHNCTLYAAYRLAQNGQGDPGWSDNAKGWDTKAAAAGTRVDQSASRGSIAQWNGGGYGHVAYVETVGSGYIEVSDDNYGWNMTNRWRISSSSPAWPDNFLHIKDTAASPTVKPPAGPSVRDQLLTNQALRRGQQITSANGRYTLVQQSTDGNLVLYKTGGIALWATGRGADWTIMQNDGNLVSYTANGAAVWSSRTGGAGAGRLIVQNDGNVVIYRNSDGRVIWATRTNGR